MNEQMNEQKSREYQFKIPEEMRRYLFFLITESRNSSISK